MIADMLRNKKLIPKAGELFMTGKNINSFLVFITKSYIAVLINIWLNSAYYFVMKIPNKWELQ